jgi:hypothetical protein
MKKYFLLLTVIVSFTACKEEKEDQPEPTPELTKTEMITNKNWVIIAQTSTTTNTTSPNTTPVVQDNFAQFDNCKKDDFITFQPTFKFIRDEGNVKCIWYSSQATDGSWTFANNETKVMVTGRNVVNMEADVLELTAEKLVLKTHESYAIGNDGYHVEIVSTYVPQ